MTTITEARLAKGWSQRELAREAGLDPATVSRIESGAVGPRLTHLTAMALAKALDIDPAELSC